jgi:hypothetical protein
LDCCACANDDAIKKTDAIVVRRNFTSNSVPEFLSLACIPRGAQVSGWAMSAASRQLRNPRP